LSSVEHLAELADLNQLQTALNTAIAAENWELAAKLRDLLHTLTGADGRQAADWKRLGILGWLADRAESLGFNFPTGKPWDLGRWRFQQPLFHNPCLRPATVPRL
jgi:hypothetical protein